ncbi:TlpA family protein disulfide reductase [Paraflavitalea soli]|uniref:TlpA family protein disulfide reductase n=1 Tax=Paraflavitalea soli TaxID=2315862 RepID=A0A3B7MUZ1_9BACT|nr:TlpA disulfide reductase family protein [Paraflavitalea soli]AXY77908.1 TlpA family protein disulfide reductase [Paraflavitalea soli]
MRIVVKKVLLSLLLVSSLVIISSAATHAKAELRPGIYKAVIQRTDGQQIVFNFEVASPHGKPVLYVLNASERMLVDDIRQQGDSLWITMPFYDAHFATVIKPNGSLEGKFIKISGDRRSEIPFYALPGNKERYPVTARPAYNVSGRWAARFGEGKDETLAVGEFVQAANGKVTGTFLTPTGDYRYLEGAIAADTLKLSAFDGSHVYLFTAKLDNDSTITQAVFYAGASGTEKWVAHKDPKAKLPDGFDAVKLRPGESKLNFSFPATDGKKVSINDARYKNKVVVVQILGSWCPNCMDETKFLVDYYKKNKQRGVEIVGLAYERTTDFERSKQSLATFQKRLGVNYPFLVTTAAVSDPKRTEKTLPQIEPLQGFPTTIFIDKKGNVRKIHTGYDGPATGQHYEAFKKEFEELITSLLAEK